MHIKIDFSGDVTLESYQPGFHIFSHVFDVSDGKIVND